MPSWSAGPGTGAPRLDLVLVLCPSVSGAIAPDWNGTPLTVDWHMDDPAAAPAGQMDLAGQHAYHRLSVRVNALLTLPFETLAADELQARLTAIGET